MQKVTSQGYGWQISTSGNNPPTAIISLSFVQYDFKNKVNTYSYSGDRPLNMEIMATKDHYSALIHMKGRLDELILVNRKKSPISKVLMTMPDENAGCFEYDEDLFYLRKYNDFYKVENGNLSQVSSFPKEVLISSGNNNMIFTTPKQGFVLLRDTLSDFLAITKDSGQSWVFNRLDSTKAINTLDIRLIDFIDPANGLIVGEMGKIYLSIDSGETWTTDSINTGFQAHYNFISNNGTSYYLAGDSTNEIYKSDDFGRTWQSVPIVGFDIKKIRDLNCPRWDRCFVIDENGFIYMNQEVTGVSDLKSEETSISIYPNPCQNELFINGLDINEGVQIDLLNSNGKLVDSFRGLQSINTSQLSKGLYLLRIISERKNEVIKFVKN